MNLNRNLKLMLHVLTHAALGALGVRRCTSRRALFNRAEEGSLNAQLQQRVIMPRTAREGRAWRESEEA